MDPLKDWDRRPPESLTREDIKEWMRNNYLFKKTWNHMAPIMRARDQRGIRKENFALGYICALIAVRNQVEEFDEKVRKAIEKVVADSLKDIERTSHLGQID